MRKLNIGIWDKSCLCSLATERALENGYAAGKVGSIVGSAEGAAGKRHACDQILGSLGDAPQALGQEWLPATSDEGLVYPGAS